MNIEITKKQFEAALDEYVDGFNTTEDFGRFIRKLVRRYAQWSGADTSALLKEFVDRDVPTPGKLSGDEM